MWTANQNKGCGWVKAKRRWLNFFIPILLAVTEIAHGEEYKNIRLGGFSPNGGKLALSYCTDRPNCKFGYYDFRKQIFISITQQDSNQILSPGGFSPDGSRIAVAVRRNSENGHFSQVGVLDLGTLTISELTNSPSYKAGPSFSHDGKKILFAQSNRERESGKTRFSDWDIYELDISNKKERRLTALRFYAVTPPSYLPGDQSFIFSGDSPYEYVSPSGEKGYSSYKSRYNDNQIFVISSYEKKPLSPIFTNGDSSDFPTISTDGDKIVYSARTDKLDGVKTRFTYDLFLFDGKRHNRLTRLDSLISDIVLSFDGRIVAFVEQPHENLNLRRLKVLDVSTGKMESIGPERLDSGANIGR